MGLKQCLVNGIEATLLRSVQREFVRLSAPRNSLGLHKGNLLGFSVVPDLPSHRRPIRIVDLDGRRGWRAKLQRLPVVLDHDSRLSQPAMKNSAGQVRARVDVVEDESEHDVHRRPQCGPIEQWSPSGIRANP